MKNKIVMILATSLLLSGCTSLNDQETNVATSSNLLVQSDPITFGDYILRLGDKIGDHLFEIIAENEVSSNGEMNALTTPISTYDDLEAYMKENYSIVKDGSATDKEIDSYIRGYSKASNVRVLGGTNNDCYMTITLYNPTNESVLPSNAYLKNIWVLGTPKRNGKYINVSYKDISLGEDSSDVDLSSYSELESDYADTEYTNKDGDIEETIYIKDNKVFGLRLNY